MAAVASPSCHVDRRLKTTPDVASMNSLPDEILHQILSYIPTKLAITTSVLSKRWRPVWRETPSLDFHNFKSSDESETIIETLASYAAPKTTSFHICSSVSNKQKAELVNSLIKFALSRNTEKLSLQVRTSNDMIYHLPDFLFSNYSLKQLIVDTGSSRINPNCIVSWASLRSLSLICVHLSDETLSRMLCGCPMLESLILEYKGYVENLDLSHSLSLKRLNIDFVSCVPEPMQIVAPHIHSLRLRNLRATDDVSSLAEADIDFNKLLPRKSCSGKDRLKHVLHAMVETMLEKLKNVGKLTLGVSFLQMLSIAVFRGVLFPAMNVKTLTLETRILQSVVPSITKLLTNSPEVKKITISTIECSTNVDAYVYEYLDKQGFNHDQYHRLKNMFSRDSWERQVAEPILVGAFVEILLENIRTLETVVLGFQRYVDKSRLRELSEIIHTLSHNNKMLSIAEFRCVLFPALNVKTLTLETRILQSVVPGIAKLLENSPEVKKITISAIKCITNVDIRVNDYLAKQGFNHDQYHRLKNVVSRASWERQVEEPILVGAFVEILLENTRTLETVVLRLKSYFDRSRLKELSEITHTLSHNKKVSIMLS